ncbi:uncharacterized protein LTR77_005223 [Saxophila tyrrhenica]|uniref:Carboxypeptidase n=1 Tax=Saxophila tyrrhenica TaxID=1690608 RepID=A0AAV9PBL3_9PEZI|nr:hypothetical protein LTR77_005223 [Saxophila tyrrhenica]
MHILLFLGALLGAAGVSAVESPHKRALPKRKAAIPNTERANSAHAKRAHLNDKTKKFAVDGKGLPEVNFDIGESYAGTLSIDDDPDNENQLWFWFFPSENPAAGNEITLWLNGGPGCSSLDGLLQENGPFLWQSGTFRPIANPYSWVNLTNMVWVDQPIGTGFSPNAKGAVKKLKTEHDVSVDFMGFWKNFMETFNLTGRDVYLTGESYAGQYIPYISYNMLQANDTDYYNVKGIQINDPSINEGDTMTEAPAINYVNEYSNIFNLNETTMAWLNQRNEECGYADFMENALSYPPKGPIPTAPDSYRKHCNLWEYATSAAIYINPCFNFYHIIGQSGNPAVCGSR